MVSARGYPATPITGGAIGGIGAAEANGAVVFQAGTGLDGDALVARGGRVLAVTAVGAHVRAARDLAYAAVERIDYADGFYRRDIGWRALEGGGD